jgi:HEAT repeat protein
MPRRDPLPGGRSAFWFVLLAVGVVGTVCLLTCGLGLYIIYQMMIVPARRQVDVQLDAVGLVPLDVPRDLDEALADLSGADPLKKRAAARWLALQPVDPARQAEVARALDLLLADADRKTVEAGVWALRSWATRENVPALAALLDRTPLDKADDAERHAMGILGRFPDPKAAVAVARYLPNAFFNVASRDSLKAMGPVAEPAVLAYMHDGDAERFARELLKDFGTSREAQALQSVTDLRSPVEHRRHSAAEWLAQGPADPAARPAVFAALVQFIEGPDDGNRQLAIRGLDVWASPDDAPALLALLQNPGKSPHALQVRCKAMRLLGKFQHAPAVPVICQRLSVLEDRHDACAALEAMGPLARDEVMKYLDKGDGVTREAVVGVLKKIAPGENVELTRALKDLQSPEARWRMEGASWFARQAAPVPAVQAEAARALAKCLDETFSPQCADAAKALKVWATPAEVPALIKAASDVSDNVRRPALEALAKLKDPRAIGPLAKRLAANHDLKEVSAALVAMGPAVEPEVVKVLAEMNRDVRVEVCRILQAVGTGASLPALEAAAKVAAQRNEPEVVRAADSAAKAIKARS